MDEEALESLGVTLRSVSGKGGEPGTRLSLNVPDRGFYYYRRWVWIQFPWMVLCCGKVRAGTAGVGEGVWGSIGSAFRVVWTWLGVVSETRRWRRWWRWLWRLRVGLFSILFCVGCCTALAFDWLCARRIVAV